MLDIENRMCKGIEVRKFLVVLGYIRSFFGLD